MVRKDTRVVARGGVLGPFDVGELRLLRQALEQWLDDHTPPKGDDTIPTRQAEIVHKASNYFKNVIDTGQL
jgi:hypothetical protein